MKILVIADDERISETLNLDLQAHWDNLEVVSCPTGAADLGVLEASQADLVLLAVSGDSGRGFDVLRIIRQASDVPLIALSAQAEELEQVRCLQMGADDYVATPCRLLPLMARIKGVLRRAKLPQPNDFSADFAAGDLTVRFRDQVVRCGGRPVKLTPVEYRVLFQLVHNAGSLMPHQARLDRVWGWDRGHSVEYLRLFIGRLRAKLETPGGPRYIRTERRRGYRFVRPTATPAGVFALAPVA